MSFKVSWPKFSDNFLEKAKVQLSVALNKGEKPANIVDHISVVDLNMGTKPPDLEILEIGELGEDRFRGIFRMMYSGDAHVVLQTKVQANPLTEPKYVYSIHKRRSGMLAASRPLVVPMQLRISNLKLRGIIVLVVDKAKGITLVFKNDPLERVDVNSTFDNVASIRRFLQNQIEGQLRKMFQDDLPQLIHNLSLELIQKKEGTNGQGATEEEEGRQDVGELVLTDEDVQRLVNRPHHQKWRENEPVIGGMVEPGSWESVGHEDGPAMEMVGGFVLYKPLGPKTPPNSGLQRILDPEDVIADVLPHAKEHRKSFLARVLLADSYYEQLRQQELASDAAAAPAGDLASSVSNLSVSRADSAEKGDRVGPVSPKSPLSGLTLAISAKTSPQRLEPPMSESNFSTTNSPTASNSGSLRRPSSASSVSGYSRTSGQTTPPPPLGSALPPRVYLPASRTTAGNIDASHLQVPATPLNALHQHIHRSRSFANGGVVDTTRSEFGPAWTEDSISVSGHTVQSSPITMHFRRSTPRVSEPGVFSPSSPRRVGYSPVSSPMLSSTRVDLQGMAMPPSLLLNGRSGSQGAHSVAGTATGRLIGTDRSDSVVAAPQEYLVPGGQHGSNGQNQNSTGSSNVTERSQQIMTQNVVLQPTDNEVAAHLASLMQAHHTMAPLTHHLEHATFRTLPHHKDSHHNHHHHHSRGEHQYHSGGHEKPAGLSMSRTGSGAGTPVMSPYGSGLFLQTAHSTTSANTAASTGAPSVVSGATTLVLQSPMIPPTDLPETPNSTIGTPTSGPSSPILSPTLSASNSGTNLSQSMMTTYSRRRMTPRTVRTLRLPAGVVVPGLSLSPSSQSLANHGSGSANGQSSTMSTSSSSSSVTLAKTRSRAGSSTADSVNGNAVPSNSSNTTSPLLVVNQPRMKRSSVSSQQPQHQRNEVTKE